LIERDLRLDVKSHPALNKDQISKAQSRSEDRILEALFFIMELGDPRAKPVLEQTKQVWEKLHPNEPRINIPKQCDEALLAIQNAEAKKQAGQ